MDSRKLISKLDGSFFSLNIFLKGNADVVFWHYFELQWSKNTFVSIITFKSLKICAVWKQSGWMLNECNAKSYVAWKSAKSFVYLSGSMCNFMYECVYCTFYTHTHMYSMYVHSFWAHICTAHTAATPWLCSHSICVHVSNCSAMYYTLGWALQHQVCDPNFYHLFCWRNWS